MNKYKFLVFGATLLFGGATFFLFLHTFLLGDTSVQAQVVSVATTQSGNWSDSATWSGGAVPTTGDTVKIALGHTVTYDVVSDDVLEEITVEGTLKFSRITNTRLRAGDNFLVKTGGFLDMGTEIDPIPKGINLELIFTLTQVEIDNYVGGGVPNTGGFEPTDKGLWVFPQGRWETHGAEHVRTWTKLNADAVSGATSLIVENDVRDWYIGGDVLITQTNNPAQINTNWFNVENEVRTISSITPLAAGKTQITFLQPLSFFHQGSGEMRGEVGLLTRNVLVTTDIVGVNEKDFEAFTVAGRDGRKFAHTAFFEGSSGNVQYTEFKYMGHHTALGRYPVHFHILNDTSAGSVIRGNAVWYSGFRAYVLHESDDVLLEDNISFSTIASPYFFEMSTVRSTFCNIELAAVKSPPEDNMISHNLGVQSLPTVSHPNDFGGTTLARDAAIFWFDQFVYQNVFGNVAVGSHAQVPKGVNATNNGGFQMDEVCNFIVPGKTRYFNFQANEAHSNSRAGLQTWNNPKSFDLNDFFAWRNGGAGFEWFTYVPPYRVFQSRLYENATSGINTWGVRLHVQDSVIKSGGTDWTQARGYNKRGVNIGAYVAIPTPETSAHFIRTTFENTAPNYEGDIVQKHDVCSDPVAELTMAGKSGCRPNFFDLAANSYTDKAFDFGQQPNANSYFQITDYQGPSNYPDNFYITRKDQPFGSAKTPLIQSIVNTNTTYDALSDAMISPSTRIAASGLTSLPPQISLTVAMVGTVATLTATVTDDNSANPKVEFFVDENIVATKIAAPYTATIDLAGSNRRYAYIYARAFDGDPDLAALAPCVARDFNGCPKVQYPFLQQKAYSKVTTIGPEVLIQNQPLPPGTPDPKLFDRPHVFLDKVRQVTLTGTNLTGDFKAEFIKSGVSVLTFSSTAGTGTTIPLDFTTKNLSSVAVGKYTLQITRVSDLQTFTHPVTFVFTRLGDLWSPTATSLSTQKRDGAVNIADVSHLFTRWGKTTAADLAEADINGPGGISDGVIDIFDANRLMANWTG